MGKSTTAGFFREAGVPVWDADAAVHRIYANDRGVAAEIGALVPTAIRDGQVQRPALRDAIATDAGLLKRIEAIVHPRVAADRAAFLAEAGDASLVVLDIPLLFETGGEAIVDAVLVVTAPAEVQRARVLARPGMTEAQFKHILGRQVPDAEKRARADHVIDTSRGLDAARADVHDLIERLTGGTSDA
ncbi:MAG: dephospho-CoA kinase [Pseudomonadota bacterium]